MSCLMNCLGYPKPPRDNLSDPDLTVVRLFSQQLKREFAISVHTPPPQLPLQPYVFIYSHGNSENIPLSQLWMDDLCRILRSTFICYDYLGYGETSGRPSESSSIVICEQILNYAKENYPESQIVLWGRSIGSVPTVSVGRNSLVSGIIVESGLSSGLNLVCEKPVCKCLDGFKNVQKLGAVNCPVLLMHGTDDEVVPFRCSVQNLQVLKSKYRAQQDLGASKIQSDVKQEIQENVIQESAVKQTDLMNSQIQNAQNETEIEFETKTQNQLTRSGKNWHYAFFQGGHNDLDTACEKQLVDIVIKFLKNVFGEEEFTNCSVENKKVRFQRKIDASRMTRIM
ncbi:Serine_aminopeptidase [Hexamita inflata]|uniref:Serine aminopeptidase n=1 Tax=Hexamita inflata TaxID=28002 RepID=A0AA86NW41_9EUKA|nr:Serine aminopeptidase [Hexamita inflata]